MDANTTSSLIGPSQLPWRVPNRKRRRQIAVFDLWDLILLAIGDVASGRAHTGPEPEEVALVRSMGERNSDAAQEIYRRYSEPLHRFIYRRIGERSEDAEELTLDTFLSAIDLSRTYGGQSSVFVWLCGIAKLRLIDFHRRSTSAKCISREDQTSLDELDEERIIGSDGGSRSVEEVLDRLLASEVVDAALSRLNADEREALLLRYVEGFSVREIAGLMKRTEKAVESLLMRAKAKPRDFLLRMLGEEVAR